MVEPEAGGCPDPPARWFATTHWSVVLAAGQQTCSEANEALEKLCRTYWYPLYAYVRRQGHSPHDAQDLTQGFFAHFLEKNYFRLADPQKGKFRSFLLVCLKRFLVNEFEQSKSIKRGGGTVQIELDETAAEELYRLEASPEADLDKLFDRSWAFTVLDRARNRLQGEYTREGKAEKFAQLAQFLPGAEATETYAQVAERLKVAEGTIKSDMHRMRQRFGQSLRAEIADTVSSPKEIDEEIKYLIAAITG